MSHLVYIFTLIINHETYFNIVISSSLKHKRLKLILVKNKCRLSVFRIHDIPRNYMYKISLFCANELKYSAFNYNICSLYLPLTNSAEVEPNQTQTVAVVEWGLKIHIGEVSSSYNESKSTDFSQFRGEQHQTSQQLFIII